MASDNLMALEQPWQFRSTFSDAWISDNFIKENEFLTKALQRSFGSASNDDVFPVDLLDSLLNQPEITPVHTPTISGASENEFPVTKPRRILPPSGRVAKRKSRASKRATTTFITADPDNFRQLVQQVTGVRLGGANGEVPMVSVLKPEPQRAAERMQPGGGMPNFDTSSFLLDSASFLMNGTMQPSTSVADGGAAGFAFDSFCCFPTLESSWKV